jgi:hypothetical protein
MLRRVLVGINKDRNARYNKRNERLSFPYAQTRPKKSKEKREREEKASLYAIGTTHYSLTHSIQKKKKHKERKIPLLSLQHSLARAQKAARAKTRDSQHYYFFI